MRIVGSSWRGTSVRDGLVPLPWICAESCVERAPVFDSDGNGREKSIVNIAAPSPVSFPAIVAHQGGWDEILLVAGPIAVIVGLLALVKRRIDAQVNVASTESNDPERGSSGDVDRSALDGSSDSA